MVVPKIKVDEFLVSDLKSTFEIIDKIDTIEKNISKFKKNIYKKTKDICRDSNTISQLTREFQKTCFYHQNNTIQNKITGFLTKFIFRDKINHLKNENSSLHLNISIFENIASTDTFKSELKKLYYLIETRIVEEGSIKNKFDEYTNSFLLCKNLRNIISLNEIKYNPEIRSIFKKIDALSTSLIHEISSSPSVSENDENILLRLNKEGLNIINQKPSRKIT